MKSKLFFILLFSVNTLTYSQVKSTSNNYWVAKDFSKQIALYNAKTFLFRDILGVTPDVTQFEIVPLAAASSGELTTLLYKCQSKQKEGMVLGFYGNFWTDNGVLYQGYAFKNMDKEKAIDFMGKIQNAIDSNLKFLLEKDDNNNICFIYDDITVLIWALGIADTYTIRLFWNGFDCSWENTAFERSKRRFEKKIK